MCFSYLTHITLTKSYKHNHTQAHEVTLLKNTNKNNQNNTQKPKDTHTPNKCKYQDTQTLKNTAVLFILGFHVTEFCPAISPISNQPLIQMKVHQQNACQLHTLVLLQCLNFCTLVLNFSLPWCNLIFFNPSLSFFLSQSLNVKISTTSNLYRQPSALNSINHIGLELCPH